MIKRIWNYSTLILAVFSAFDAVAGTTPNSASVDQDFTYVLLHAAWGPGWALQEVD